LENLQKLYAKFLLALINLLFIKLFETYRLPNVYSRKVYGRTMRSSIHSYSHYSHRSSNRHYLPLHERVLKLQ
jgi:hypothetical protein